MAFVEFFRVELMYGNIAVLKLGRQSILLRSCEDDCFLTNYLIGGDLYGDIWTMDAQGVTEALWEFAVTCDRACSEGRRLPSWPNTPWG